MKKMTMKKYVVTVCQEVKYMIVCVALLLSFFTTVNAAEKYEHSCADHDAILQMGF